MRRIDWTKQALADLRSIHRWLAEEANLRIAIDQLRSIRERANFLKDFPLGGPAFDQGEVRMLRVLGISYRLHYRLVGSDGIQILRVKHVRQDGPSLR